jgi:hypothetical protein
MKNLLLINFKELKLVLLIKFINKLYKGKRLEIKLIKIIKLKFNLNIIKTNRKIQEIKIQ